MCIPEHILNTIRMNLFEGFFFIILMVSQKKCHVQGGDVA